MSTVAIDPATHQRLQNLKQSWGLSTYNEVIHRLLDTATGTPKSMFGIDQGMAPFTRKERTEMWGE